MAVDALVAMGRGDYAVAWAIEYGKRLDHAPRPARTRVEASNWREALGDYARVGEWEAMFRQEMEGAPWQDVLATWTWRLAPGFLAGATHGLLRTAHATRALLETESESRRNELARGLAYWAARYTELPEEVGTGGLPLDEALRRVSIVPQDERPPVFLITAGIAPLAERPEFADVLGLLEVPEDVSGVLSQLTRTFAELYLAHAASAPIVFVHSVTAPSAIRIIAPALPKGHVRRLVRYAWQANAAFLAAFSMPGAEAGMLRTLPARDDITDMAVASMDEHAIKFADACLREYALNPDPVFLAAASDLAVRMGG
jgi:hypothetical protein